MIDVELKMTPREMRSCADPVLAAMDTAVRNGFSIDEVLMATLFCLKAGAVLTDPPYGVLDEPWDRMDSRELARFTMGWVSRVALHSEYCMVFFGERTRSVICPILEAVYPDVRQIIWNKGGGQIAEDRLFYSYESIFYCHPEDTWEVAEPKSLAVGQLIAKARCSAGLSRGGIDMLVRGKKTGLCFRWEEGACFPTDAQAEALRKALPLGADFDAALAAARLATAGVVALARAEAAQRAARGVDVIACAPPSSRHHPTEKPVPLLEIMLEVLPAGTVLDPFMGSGSTGVACVGLGRPFIGVEKEPKYFEIACRRIEDAQRQSRMFA
jgi:DNA modification methylase